MMAIDASALVAIINDEPEREPFLQVIGAAKGPVVSPVSVVEARMVLQGRRGTMGVSRVNALMTALEIDIAPVDPVQLDVLHDAFLRYGRGSGSGAKLNMGDLFSYALAKSRDIPLLYKGNDFSRTDIRPALPA